MKRSIYLYIFILLGLVPVAMLAQPANDDCTGAISFGSLDVPATCTGGGGGGINQGATTTLTGTNIGATPSAPYPYGANCPVSIYNLPKDVWYSFVATGYQTTISISNATGTLTDPSITVWTGTCANLNGVACVSGAGPTPSVTVYQTVIGQTYFVQVAGADSTQVGTFSISAACANNCATCVLQSNITASIPPVNGTYNPGDTVTFCYTVSQYNQINANWLHGVTVSFGPGWDPSSLVVGTPPPSCATTTGASWGWYPNGETSTACGNYWGPGFYYETSSGASCNCINNNPGDNFGDVDAGQGACSPTFCITLTVSANAPQGSNLNVSFTTTGDGESGGWGSNCDENSCGPGVDTSNTFFAITSCGPPVLTYLPASCNEPDGIDTATAVGNYSPYVFHWSTGYSDTAARQSIVRNLLPGQYTVTVTNSAGCSIVAVNTITNVQVPDGGPTLYLSCPSVVDSVVMAGVGPGTWSALSTNPAPTIIANPALPNTAISGFTTLGTYKYVWTVSTCTDTVSVIVTSHPDAGPDIYTCVDGTATMAAVGTGTWAALPGNPAPTVIADSTANNTVISGFTVGGTYNYVWYVNTCRDTASVIIPNFVSSATIANSVLCKFQSTSVSATAGPPALGPFAYAWSPASSLASPGSASSATYPITVPTTFIVTVTSQSGCHLYDTVSVALSGAAPQVHISPSDNNVCPGDTVALNGVVLAESLVQCGLTDTLFTNNSIVTGYLNNDTTSTTGGTFGTAVYCSPFMGSYNSYKAQYLITAAELNAIGLSSGTITDFAFFVKTLNSTAGYDTFSVSMGCTNLDSLTAFVNNLQVVIPPQYGGNAIFPNQGWTPLPFTNYFNWDGVSNIVIQICYTIDPNITSNDDYVSYSTTPYSGSCIVAGDDFGENIDGCSLDASADLYLVTNTRPNFLFHNSVPTVLTYRWTPPTLLCDTCPSTSVIVLSDSTYTLTVNDNGCPNDTVARILINPYLAINATPDTTICGGSDTVRLNVALTNLPVSQCVQGYTVSSIPYSTISGNITLIPPVEYEDEFGDPYSTENGTAGPFNVGFTFPFYCQSYSQFYVNSNGWITFAYPYPFANPADEYTAQTLPSTDPQPMKAIELMMGEYWLADGFGDGGGSIDYFVTGSAPNRILVVQFNSMDDINQVSTTTGEMHLYETTGVIDILLTSSNYSGTNHTTGVKDSSGLGTAAAPSRNNQLYTITSHEAWRFTPQYGSSVAVTGAIWSPNNFLSNDSIVNPLATPPTSQTYYVNTTLVLNQFTHPTNCVVRDSVVITHGTFPNTVTATPPTICPGDTSQLLFSSTSTVTSYIWTPASGLSATTIANPLASVLDTTAFYVTATNNTGCRITDTVIVNVVPTPHPYLGDDSVVCFSDSVLLSLPGAYSNYQWFSIDTATGVRTALSSGATDVSYYAQAPGSYVLEVTSSGVQCSYYTSIVSLDTFARQPIVVDTSGPTGFCTGGNVILQVSQGVSNIQWTPAGFGSQQSFPVSTSGVFYYSATDQHGCVLHSDTVTVSVNPVPAIVVDSFKNPICSANQDTLTAGSSPAGATITWTYNGTQTTGNTIVTTDTGTYYIQADLQGCSTFDTILLTGAPSPIVTLPAPYTECNCHPDTVVAPSVTNGTPAYTFLWSNGSTDSTTTDTTLNASQYTVTVTDANGCVAVSNTQTITMSCPRADISVFPINDSIFIRDTATLTAIVPAGAIYTYLWTCDSARVTAPDSNITGIIAEGGVWDTVYLTVTDPATLCTNTIYKVVNVSQYGAFKMPTAFSPNGDGINDNFYPAFNGPNSPAKVVSIRIYDRWGQLMYDDPNAPGWDGTFGGNPQPVGTYVYFITISFPDPTDPGRLIETSTEGSFMLFR